MQEKKFLKHIGKRIKGMRKIMGLSQEELAEISGLHPTYIGEIERATVNPSIVKLYTIAIALKVPLSDLLEVTNKKDTEKDHIIQKLAAVLRNQNINFIRFIEKSTAELIILIKKQKKKK